MKQLATTLALWLGLGIAGVGIGSAQATLLETPTAPSAAPGAMDRRSKPLVGTLRDADAWRGYKARFVTPAGRVVDTGNHGISHSEGQGYGMLLAVAADDRATFDTIWGWTRANLMVRDDELMAWRWEPNQRPSVSDMNDASDGDLLVAWALTEASEAWGSLPYKVAARRIAVEVGRKLVVPHTPQGSILLPGIVGFAAEDRTDGPVVNLSYWVFPAFARLPLVAPDVDWAGLSRDGMQLIKRTRFGPANLPTEWVSLHETVPRSADGFEKTFAYNAVRIPLYIAWAGLGQREIYAPFVAVWPRGGRLPIINTATGRPSNWLGERGYSTVAALTACAASGAKISSDDRRVHSGENYYPVTLSMLALIAAHMRYPSCFAN